MSEEKTCNGGCALGIWYCCDESGLIWMEDGGRDFTVDSVERFDFCPFCGRRINPDEPIPCRVEPVEVTLNGPCRLHRQQR